MIEIELNKGGDFLHNYKNNPHISESIILQVNR